MRRIQILFSFLVIVMLAFGRCSYDDVNGNFDCSQSTLAIQLQSKTDVTNCRGIDGTITVTATGGAEPYDYQIPGREYQTNNVFEDLGVGTYEVTVKDKNGCSTSISVTINTFGSTLKATVQTTADNQCSTDNGTVTVTATGGVAPYEYQIDSKGFTNSNVFDGIKEGSHQVFVRDSEGCQATVSVKVDHGNTGLSYENDIKSIITTNCAKSGCHDAGAGSRNWTDFAILKANASNIKLRTANRSMPPDAVLSQSDIDKIGCWVDDGALAN